MIDESSIIMIWKLNITTILFRCFWILICEFLLLYSVSFAEDLRTNYGPSPIERVYQAKPAIDSLITSLGYKSYSEVYTVCKREALFDAFGHYNLSRSRADFRKTVEYCRLIIFADSAETSVPICIFIRKVDGSILGYLIGRTDEPDYANWASLDDIVFNIEVLGADVSDGITRCTELDSIMIRFIWKNISPESVILFLERSDSAGSYTDRVHGLVTRIINDECKIFTNHEVTRQQDLSKYQFLEGSSYDESRYDTVMVRPAERVIRDISLKEILWSAPVFRGGIQPGVYRVQLSLGNLVSNELRIEIVE